MQAQPQTATLKVIVRVIYIYFFKITNISYLPGFAQSSSDPPLLGFLWHSGLHPPAEFPYCKSLAMGALVCALASELFSVCP